MEDDWDLQAVVRSCATTTSSSSSSSTATATAAGTWFKEAHPSSRSQPQQEDHSSFCFPDLFDTRSESLEELHDLFKPFFPKLQPVSRQNMPISPLSVLGGLQDLSHQQHQQKHLQTKQSLGGPRSTTAGGARHSQNPRSKRRKNQMKRVCQVPAEGLSSDMWSWRKYGQKPIKGSPYPRGYYRCSTSKGCLARKQVERNRSDPNKWVFIVTYTGEHNHPMPTHRNSLAGSTRQKPVAADDPASKPSCSPPGSPAASLSPATEKTESREEMAEDDDDEYGFSDVAMGDDFFEGLEELAGPAAGDCFSDSFPASLPFPWSANNATTTAAGGC
ncbi:hypothetical protein RJ640_006177 [Escallonia rubra]|uniref:WRKY domain-containing protein n=1 Tax=Escallonia rubra TaxID=112253 RepID=A0AA88RTE2_9ASTE|nr:hypothetical protein RJ640_006177 [Escallonia rubra]